MHSEYFRSRKKVTMNLDQAHSYLIIVLIRLECFAAPQKVVSAAETSRARLQANSRSKRDLLRRRAAGGACWEKAAPNLAQTAATSKRVGERSVTFSGRGAATERERGGLF